MEIKSAKNDLTDVTLQNLLQIGHAHPHVPGGETAPLNMDGVKSKMASGVDETVEDN